MDKSDPSGRPRAFDAFNVRSRARRTGARPGGAGGRPVAAVLRQNTSRTHIIGLVIDPHDEVLGHSRPIATGLTEALRGTDYRLVVVPCFADQSPVDPVLHILRNSAADGIVFSRVEADDPRVRLLVEHDFPFVAHGRAISSGTHPFVDYDNRAFAYHAALRLQAKGCRRLTITLPPERFTFGSHLREGFLTAIAETGLGWEFFAGANLDSPAEAIRRATVARLAEPDAPDGYIVTGDAAALAVMAGLADSGREVGKDVHLVVKQHSSMFSQVRPRVDAIFEDTALAGRQLGELLLRRIDGAAPETLQILHEPDLWFQGPAPKGN